MKPRDPLQAVFQTAAALDYLDVAPAAREDCKLSLLDLLACRAAAGDGNLWDTSSADPTATTQTNAFLSHTTDFDPVHPRSHGHPAAMLFPALLPYFASGRCSGADLLTAYAVGHEAMCFFGDLAGQALRDAGRHPTCMLGAIGVAVAVSRIFGLPAQKMEEAAFLAASATDGYAVGFGSGAKAFQVSIAARNGHAAAVTAANRTLVPIDPLGGLGGVLDHLPRRLDASDVAPFGEPWRVQSAPTFHKPLAICGYLITTVLGFADQVRDRASTEAETMEVRVPRSVAAVCRPGLPETVDEARFALAFLLSVCLLHRVEDFEAEFAALRGSRRVTRMTKAVTVKHDPLSDDDGFVRIALYHQSGRPEQFLIPVNGDAELLNGTRVVAEKWERHAARRFPQGFARATQNLESTYGPDWCEMLQKGSPT
jgi:2-methylcitrate dehydratase PrpD